MLYGHSAHSWPPCAECRRCFAFRSFRAVFRAFKFRCAQHFMDCSKRRKGLRVRNMLGTTSTRTQRTTRTAVSGVDERWRPFLFDPRASCELIVVETAHAPVIRIAFVRRQVTSAHYAFSNAIMSVPTKLRIFMSSWASCHNTQVRSARCIVLTADVGVHAEEGGRRR